jgi:methionyl-tRNA formyltransferase
MKAPDMVFMGTPEFAATTLRYLIANECNIIAAYTQRDKAAGRGRILVPSPVKKAAQEANVTVVQPRNFRNEEAVAELAARKPDLVVVAAYGQILPQSVLDVPRCGCLNVHPSLLPKFRGVSPVAASILAGDEFTGVSVMLLDAGTDTGPILAQAQVPVASEDTSDTLSGKLARIGAQLVLDVIPSWLSGNLGARPQNAAMASYCRKLSKADGEIDWRLSAREIWRRVRAFNSWPCAFTTWQGQQLRVLESRPLPPSEGVAPGRVIDLHDKTVGFGIGTGDGVLGVVTVQIEGKKAMPAADFLRGQRGLVGQLLG